MNPVRAGAFLLWISCLTVEVMAAPAESASSQIPECKGLQAVAAESGPDSFDDIGTRFAEEGKFRCAMLAFREVTRRDPNAWSSRFNLALALSRLGEIRLTQKRYTEAIPLFTKAAQIAPSSADLHVNWGELSREVPVWTRRYESSTRRSVSIRSRPPRDTTSRTRLFSFSDTRMRCPNCAKPWR